MVEERNRMIGALVGYSEGPPRPGSPAPNTRTFRPGSAIAAAPPPTHPSDRYDGTSREKAVVGAVVVVAVVPVVVADVVVAVVVDVVDVVVVDVVVDPAAYADAAPSAARRTPRTRNQARRHIAPVCRTRRRSGETEPNRYSTSSDWAPLRSHDGS
jgi:hypothetical protein